MYHLIMELKSPDRLPHLSDVRRDDGGRDLQHSGALIGQGGHVTLSGRSHWPGGVQHGVRVPGVAHAAHLLQGRRHQLLLAVPRGLPRPGAAPPPRHAP